MSHEIHQKIRKQLNQIPIVRESLACQSCQTKISGGGCSEPKGGFLRTSQKRRDFIRDLLDRRLAKPVS